MSRVVKGDIEMLMRVLSMQDEKDIGSGPQAGPIPQGRAKAVEAVVVATRRRLAAGLPRPAFGSEPADFLAVLRRGGRP